MKLIPMLEGGERHYFLVLDQGEEFPQALLDFSVRHELGACQFTAVGGFSEARLGYFDWERKQYLPIPVEEQVEVLALTGNVTLSDGQPQVHAHAVLSRRDGTTVGGHLISGKVRPTLELMMTELPTGVVRRKDPASGLMLINPSRISGNAAGGRKKAS